MIIRPNRKYVYEVPPELSSWHAARACDTATMASEAAASGRVAGSLIAGLNPRPEDARFLILPGHGVVVYVNRTVVVSTVPLPWLPIETRRGFYATETVTP